MGWGYSFSVGFVTFTTVRITAPSYAPNNEQGNTQAVTAKMERTWGGAAKHFVLPNIVEFGERGTPGTWGDFARGAGKAAYNMGVDIFEGMTPVGIVKSWTMGPSSRYTIADQELGGAGVVEGTIFAAGTIKSLGTIGSGVAGRIGAGGGRTFSAGTDIVQQVAREQAARGTDFLLSKLSQNELAAYLANPSAGSRFLGQAVHRATRDALNVAHEGRFGYSTRGPDFIDRATGEVIELTTPGEVGRHLARDPAVNIVTYALP